MNYRQKYEDVLEKAKIWQEHLNEIGDRDYADELNYIFPELAESEGERIRKELIEFLKLPHSQFVGNREHEKWIAWLEKQGEQTQLDYEHADIPQKDFAPIESKFKVGDFITNGYCLGKVIVITNDAYLLDTGQGIPFSCENTHLWTIQDAKDGDVLVDSYSKDSIIILYKGIDNERSILAHCGCNGYNLSLSADGFGYGELDNTNYLPATKEQRELLFKKMKQEGYEWNAEKKELKKKISGEFTDPAYENFWDSIKTEHKMLDADKVIDWLYCNICNAYDYDGNDISTTLKSKFKKDFGL